MRVLVWLLLLINIALVLAFNADLVLPNNVAQPRREIEPQKIQLLSAQQLAELAKNNTLENSQPESLTAPTVQASCYEWGEFTTLSIANVQATLDKLEIPTTIQSTPQVKRFWVYQPPLISTLMAERKIAELKAKGVETAVVVQEAKWRNAISFGLFDDEKLALQLLADLQAKGVKNVLKTLRTEDKDTANLLLNKPSDAQVRAVKQFQAQFPETHLNQVACH
jgi:hypothetical protein